MVALLGFGGFGGSFGIVLIVAMMGLRIFLISRRRQRRNGGYGPRRGPFGGGSSGGGSSGAGSSGGGSFGGPPPS
jgi:hypothetical protein